MRNSKEIKAAQKEYFEKVWYVRHKMFEAEAINEGRKEDKDILEGAKNAAKDIEKKYGKKRLLPINDFEYGMISGKLSALRWILGEEWDFLDT